jgi:MFS family permease
VFGCGVLAAAALGKVAPVIPQLRDGLGLSLAGAGWVVSAITAVPALLGTPAGLWIRRRGGRRALLAGLVILAVAGAAGAAAPDTRSMLVARLVEGVGFLLVVVAGPSLLAGMTGRTEQPLVLALWGTCIPIGLAASAFGGGALAGRWDGGCGWPYRASWRCRPRCRCRSASRSGRSKGLATLPGRGSPASAGRRCWPAASSRLR